MEDQSRSPDIFAGLGRTQRSRWLRSLVVAVISVVVVIAVFLYIHSASRIIPWVADFDTLACLRVQNISRVFTIRNEPSNPDRLWFATAEGIRVLDVSGFEWTRYGLDHGLPSETINDVTFSGSIAWVATDNGVARYDTGSDRFLPIDREEGAGSRRVLAIADAPGHGLFFALDSLGIRHLAPGDSISRPVVIQGLNSWATITCLKMIDNRLYIGAAGRVLVSYDPASGVSRKLSFKGNLPDISTMIWDIVRYKRQLIVGTSDDGIWMSRDSTDTLGELHSCPSKGAFVFAEENDGFWCGTPYGLWRYYSDGDAWMQFVNPIEKQHTDFQVTALAVTPSWLWYGSTELGAGYFNKERVQWRKMRAGLSTPNVAAIAVLDSAVWTGYGYRGEGVDRFTIDGLQYDRNFGVNDNIADPNIQVLTAHAGRIYYGGFESFGWFDSRGMNVRHFAGGSELPFGDINCIAFDTGGTAYLGAQFGMIRYLPQVDSFSVLSTTRSHRVTSIEVNGDTLWYGTLSNGLRAIDVQTSRQLTAGLDGIPGLTGVAGIDAKGTSALFVASKQDGCFIVDRQARVMRRVVIPKELTDKEDPGTPSWNIMAMRKIGSRIWLGTRSAGCLVYEPGTDQWIRLTTKDGLVSGQVRSFSDDEHWVWVGCFGGFNRMDKTWLDNVKLNDHAAVRH